MIYTVEVRKIQGIRSDRQSAWWLRMEVHDTTGDRDQGHPQEK